MMMRDLNKSSKFKYLVFILDCVGKLKQLKIHNEDKILDGFLGYTNAMFCCGHKNTMFSSSHPVLSEFFYFYA